MSSTPDEADRHFDGTLSQDAKEGARPVNLAAKRAAEEQPIIHTESGWLVGSMKRGLAKRDPSARHCTSGNYLLDDAAGGIRPGFVWVFGAETSWGKSTWLVMLVDENLRLGKRVLVVGNEDSEEVYGDRLMARRAQVSAKNLRDGKLTGPERERVTEIANGSQPKPLHLDCRKESHRQAEWIAKQVERLIADEGIDLVLFDYLQEFDLRKRVQDERVKYREIGKTFRSVVKSNNRAGVIFSQITEQQGKKYPDKNSIRECRDISNAAEAVLLGFTPKEGESMGKKCLLADKIKNGPRGFVLELDWANDSASFRRQDDPMMAGVDFNQFDNYLSDDGGNQ
jgi:replicative DNA helicase